MFRIAYVWLCATLVFTTAEKSPNADNIDELISSGSFSTRISDNIYEDARLDVPDLIRKYKYPMEEHRVTTADGYILGMHRIPHGRDTNYDPKVKRPIVFLMHGLLSSSADWVIMGPGSAFAYILAEAGFDVWMGNARGTFYSRRHRILNPDSILSNSFWEFSWDDIGNMDLPAMIDYALAHTGQESLHYVGHSQGSTVFFVMASLRPNYNQKIASMHAFAPVAYMAHNQSPLLNAISRFANNLETVASLLGLGELLPNTWVTTWAGQALCKDEAVLQQMCSNIIFLIAGWNEEQLNSTMLPVIMGHAPAGASVRQFVHYGQSIHDKGFRRYDHGLLRNLIKYGRMTPPNYELSKISAPVFLHYTINDPLAHLNDVERLYEELPNAIKVRVPLDSFNHVDFAWAIDAKSLLYDRVIDIIKAIN